MDGTGWALSETFWITAANIPTMPQAIKLNRTLRSRSAI